MSPTHVPASPNARFVVEEIAEGAPFPLVVLFLCEELSLQPDVVIRAIEERGYGELTPKGDPDAGSRVVLVEPWGDELCEVQHDSPKSELIACVFLAKRSGDNGLFELFPVDGEGV